MQLGLTKRVGRPVVVAVVALLIVSAGVAAATVGGFTASGPSSEASAPSGSDEPARAVQPNIPKSLQEEKGNLPDALVSAPVTARDGKIAALGSGDRLEILREAGDKWSPQAEVQLESFVDPDSVVASADVTGDGQPDFLVTQTAASARIGSVVSQHGGQWKVVPFQSVDGTDYATETFLSFSGNQVLSRENDCEPSCVDGTMTDVRWQYDSSTAHFVRS